MSERSEEQNDVLEPAFAQPSGIRHGFFDSQGLSLQNVLGEEEGGSVPISMSVGSEANFFTGGTISISWPGSTIGVNTRELELRNRIERLEQRVAILENKVRDLTSKLDESERIVVLRAMSREQAKEEILALFRGGKVLDYGMIAESLRLDLPLVVDICNELEREGLIG